MGFADRGCHLHNPSVSSADTSLGVAYQLPHWGGLE